MRKRLLQRVDMVREDARVHTLSYSLTRKSTTTNAHEQNKYKTSLTSTWCGRARTHARTHTHPHNAQVSFSPTSSASDDAQQCRMRFSWKSEHKIPEPVAEELGTLEGVRQKQRMSFSYKMVFL